MAAGFTLVAGTSASDFGQEGTFDFLLKCADGTTLVATPILVSGSPGPYLLQAEVAGVATLVLQDGTGVTVALQANPGPTGSPVDADGNNLPPLIPAGSVFVLCVAEPVEADLLLQDGGTLHVTGIAA
ncbi:MAG TPA: hypothetical protein VEK07_25130 [Polyangiaceae bacterium]|nr:hypothetical protein [Polyangiaceae bacterium]